MSVATLVVTVAIGAVACDPFAAIGPSRPSGVVSPSTGPETLSAAAPNGMSPSVSPGDAASSEPTSGNTGRGPAAARSLQIHATLAPWHLSRPLSRMVAFGSAASSRSVVVAGGLGVNGTVSTIERIAVGDGRATVIGRLSDPVHDAGGATLGASNLVLGGGRVTQEAMVQRIAWDGSTTPLGRLPSPRADLGVVAVRDRLVVVGGGAGGRADRAALSSTDGIHFRTVATLPVAVRYAAVATVNGTVWVVGGSTSTGDTRALQVVDPVAGTARVAGRLPRSLSHATAVVLDGRLFVVGGRHLGVPQATILEVDTATGRVTRAGRSPLAMSDGAGVVVDGVGYLIGGEAARPLDTVVELRLE